MSVDVAPPAPHGGSFSSARRRGLRHHTAGPRGTPVGLVVIADPAVDEEQLRPGWSPLGELCAQVAERAGPGQTIILASAGYVGCAHDLLVAPLERRGLVLHRDVHVGVCPALGLDVPGPGTESPVVGMASPGCTAVADAVHERIGEVRVVETLEQAEEAALSGSPWPRSGVLTKRAVDIVISSLALLVLAPLLAFIAIAIVVDGGRPALFTQERVGLNGRRFRFVKFRTMSDGAETHLADVLALNEIAGPAFQVDRDPRVTRLGRLLRRSSIDELPQLWNVLRGEMSLVGPRPAPVVEVASYTLWHRRRLTVKPGITGLAQVEARTYRHFSDRARLDLEYIDHWSILLDLKILLRTALVALRLTGR